jgi:uncharacterized protein involved in oxidation of intracellular sulfur
MRTLFIVNHPPYGTEHAFNALRLANTLSAREDQEVRLSLQGDAALCAKSGQEVPNGYSSLERMLKIARSRNVQVGVCSTCMDARGLTDEELSEGPERSTLEELADWTIWAEEVLVF